MVQYKISHRKPLIQCKECFLPPPSYGKNLSLAGLAIGDHSSRGGASPFLHLFSVISSYHLIPASILRVLVLYIMLTHLHISQQFPLPPGKRCFAAAFPTFVMIIKCILLQAVVAVAADVVAVIVTGRRISMSSARSQQRPSILAGPEARA